VGVTERGTVVVTYPGFDPGDAHTAGVLRDAGLTVRFEPRVAERTPAEVRSFMAEAVAGIVSTDPFDEAVLHGCPELRVLARVGVGTDAIDLAAATRAGVVVTITPGMNTATVADHTVGLMLACVRRLVENDVAVRRGVWNRGGELTGADLSGATVGIVGLGSIGAAVARRLQGFDVRLLGADVAVRRFAGVKIVPLDQLLAESDVITVHVPLGPATRGLIGDRELRLMRPGAVLVNTARGEVVDEPALAAALRERRVAAAGLDVFAREPPIGSPLLDLPNVIMTPHIAGISRDGQQAMVEQAVASVLAVLDGGRPGSMVNPDALDVAAQRPLEAAG
jgi:phosphoglycerate dehydrogenase-like enzyme